MKKNKEEKKDNFWMKGTIVFFIAVILSISFSIYFGKKGIEDDNKFLNSYDKLISQTFAQCLTEQGIVFYGAYWCPHCKTQKELFGDDIKFINYFECEDDKQTCIDEGVKAYPTWKIKGELYEGVRSLKELSELSSCSLN